MQTLQKLLSTVLAAFFLTAAGVTVAASDVSPVKAQAITELDSGTTQQTPDSPPDCKKNPTDPRCKR